MKFQLVERVKRSVQSGENETTADPAGHVIENHRRVEYRKSRPPVKERVAPKLWGSTEQKNGTSRLRESVVIGGLGGLVGTLSMTMFRMPTSRSLPPTSKFWAKYVGSGKPDEYPGIGLVLHLVYGIVAGIVFAAIAPGRGDEEAVAESKDAIFGTIYGIALSIFGVRIILGRILDTKLERDERLVFHISHVVYGLTLGTWVGSRLGSRENSR